MNILTHLVKVTIIYGFMVRYRVRVCLPWTNPRGICAFFSSPWIYPWKNYFQYFHNLHTGEINMSEYDRGYISLVIWAECTESLWAVCTEYQGPDTSWAWGRSTPKRLIFPNNRQIFPSCVSANFIEYYLFYLINEVKYSLNQQLIFAWYFCLFWRVEVVMVSFLK